MLKKLANKALRKKKEPLSDYRYSIDEVSEQCISGWAKNTKLTNHSPVIDVYINGLLTWQAKCNQFRQDLKDNDIGNYAFNLLPNLGVMQSDCDEIEIRIDGHLLPSKYPLSLKKGESTIATPAQPSINKEDITCYVDEVTSTHIRGWAKLNSNDSTRLIVELRANEKVYASGEASLYREDLAANSIGDGRYSFDLAFDLAEFESELVEVDLFTNGLQYSEDKIKVLAERNDIEKAIYIKEFAPEIDKIQHELDTQLANLKQELKSSLGEEPALKDVVNFTLQSISELTVRLSIMEKAMLKHMSSSNK